MQRAYSLLIAGAIALAVLLRLTQLGAPLLWHDEVTTRAFIAGYSPEDWQGALYTGEPVPVAEVRRFQHAPPGSTLTLTLTALAGDDPQHPPLYYLLARLWTGTFGDSAATLRALSALAGLALLAGMFWLALELFGSRRVAWTAVALSAASPFLVLYAREAREYALWGLLLTLHSASLLRATARAGAAPYDAKANRRAWALYALITTLALYTSLSTLAPVLVHIVYIAWLTRGRLTRVSRSAALAMLAAAALFSPWLVNLAQHYDAFERAMRWSHEIVIPASALLRIQLLNATRTLVDLWPALDHGAAWLVALSTLALYATAIAHLRRRARPDARALVLLMIALPIGLLLLPDLALGGIRSVSARYLTPAYIALLLALAAWLGAPGRLPSLRALTLAAVLVLGLISDRSNAHLAAPWTKGTNIGLPEIAALINRAPHPLVAGGRESYSPATLLALSNLLRDDAAIAFRTIEGERRWDPPGGFGAVFLLNPIPPYREAMERRGQLRTDERYSDLFLELWEVSRGAESAHGPASNPEAAQ